MKKIILICIHTRRLSSTSAENPSTQQIPRTSDAHEENEERRRKKEKNFFDERRGKREERKTGPSRTLSPSSCSNSLHHPRASPILTRIFAGLRATNYLKRAHEGKKERGKTSALKRRKEKKEEKKKKRPNPPSCTYG